MLDLSIRRKNCGCNRKADIRRCLRCGLSEQETVMSVPPRFSDSTPPELLTFKKRLRRKIVTEQLSLSLGLPFLEPVMQAVFNARPEHMVRFASTA